jgi:Flp pilus assembly protein TadD/energy-coupling factor transporter ATP-binding protein EcfA2
MSDHSSIDNQPAGGFAAISKYNPHLWSADQLRAIFVARKNELADLQHTLSSTPSGTVGQHILLVGARGMGKSTLMRRLALAVEDDPALSAAWLPLRFPEEQYTVATLGQFWANVLDSLADALQHLGQSVSELDAAAERIAAMPPAEQAAACLATIDRCADKRGQRLLLLVDNTDLLLRNIGSDTQWALRSTLQSNPRLLWVGGSYQSLEAESSYHDAFLDFFRVIHLRPLRLDEMRQALLALAETFGGSVARQQMERQLAAQPERLPTLRQLSGGNPRTTVMLYEILANGQKGNVRSDLEALLDNMTPLYKARMDALADLPRKLLAHILEHWAPISIGDLAAASQVANTSISPQLKRLELEGLIEKTGLQGTTRSGYQASERFFNIWYLMRLSPRRQRSRLAWLVEFMRLWFSGDELRTLAQQRLSDGRTAFRSSHDREYDRALADALPDQTPERHALRWSLLKQLKENRSQSAELFDLEGADADFKGADDYLRRLAELPARLHQNPHAATEEEKTQWVDAVLGSIVLNLAQKKSLAEATADLNRDNYDKLEKLLHEERRDLENRFGAAAVQAVRTAVLSQDFFPDMPDSHLAYEQIRACFAEKPEALRFGCELFYNNHNDEWCYKAQKLAQETWPQDAGIAYQCAWLLHIELGRYDEAEVAYRRAIELDEKCAYPWNGLGNLLSDQLGRSEEAEAAYRQAIELDEKSAYPWNGLGNLLSDQLGRSEEAEAAYRQAIALDEKYALPCNNLGNLLADQLDRPVEAEAAYRQAIALDEKDPYPLTNLARLLARLGRKEDAETFYLGAANKATTNDQHLLMQAHLFLGNRQLAMDALQALAAETQSGNQLAFFRLKEQIWECHELGLGERLADWMAESDAAGFLVPFVQALYTLSGATSKLRDLPLESRQMADEIVRRTRLRQKRT